MNPSGERSQPYDSAHDLPSIREMRPNLSSMKLLTRVIARDQRQVAIDLEREVTALVDLVDRFYDILGDRHWIFTGNLSVPDIRAVLDRSSTPEEAEAGLIDVIADRVRGEFWQMGLLGHEQLRARRQNIGRARDHSSERSGTVARWSS